MREKIIVKILPAEGSNPEFAPDPKEQEGIECYGYMMLLFDEDGDIRVSSLHNISIENITDAIVQNQFEGGIPELRQACVIAEGHIRAMEIQHKKEAFEFTKHLTGSLGDRLQDDPEDGEE